MPTRIKNLFNRNFLILAIVVTVVIAVLSLVNLGKQPVKFAYADKVQHLLAYFTLTLVWLLAIKKSKRAKIIIVLLCIFYGIIIEVLQVTLTSYRMAEYLDAFANSIGVLIALLVFQLFFEKKQSI